METERDFQVRAGLFKDLLGPKSAVFGINVLQATGPRTGEGGSDGLS